MKNMLLLLLFVAHHTMPRDFIPNKKLLQSRLAKMSNEELEKEKERIEKEYLKIAVEYKNADKKYLNCYKNASHNFAKNGKWDHIECQNECSDIKEKVKQKAFLDDQKYWRHLNIIYHETSNRGITNCVPSASSVMFSNFQEKVKYVSEEELSTTLAEYCLKEKNAENNRFDAYQEYKCHLSFTRSRRYCKAMYIKSCYYSQKCNTYSVKKRIIEKELKRRNQ
jgi:hypothetical protein